MENKDKIRKTKETRREESEPNLTKRLENLSCKEAKSKSQRKDQEKLQECKIEIRKIVENEINLSIFHIIILYYSKLPLNTL